MICGFSRYDKTKATRAISYLCDPHRKGREDCPPVIVAGNPKLTEQLIDSLSFERKYTSGVLSFAHGEMITPEMEREIISRFEQVAFAGLEPDQYNILWVRHEHAGHHELHFLTSRVELSTGKSLNIRPPGKGHQKVFDDFRSEINARFGLADPDDPMRKRSVSVPDYEEKASAEMLRKGLKTTSDARELINTILLRQIKVKLVQDRYGVLASLKELGLTVTRETKTSITVIDPSNEKKKIRLTGEIYARGFSLTEALARGRAETERRNRESSADRYCRLRSIVDSHIERRTKQNQERYQCRQAGGPDRIGDYPEKGSNLAVDSNNRSARSLCDFCRRNLRDDSLLVSRNPKPRVDKTGIEQGNRSTETDMGRPEKGTGRSSNQQFVVRPNRPESQNSERTRQGVPSGHLAQTSQGIDDDRFGKSLPRGVREDFEAICRTTDGFTSNVQQYEKGLRESQKSVQQRFEKTRGGFDRTQDSQGRKSVFDEFITSVHRFCDTLGKRTEIICKQIDQVLSRLAAQKKKLERQSYFYFRRSSQNKGMER